MKTTQFTEHPAVFHLIDDLKKEGIPKKVFSDVIDDEGHQYVELVMEGGGVLGVALIGYNYVLEQMGLRFFSLAGTSAGSINALLLAAMGDVSKPKAERLVEILANKNLMEFVDGDDDAQDLVKAIVRGDGMMKMIWKGVQVIDNLRDDIGLNPGDDFLKWMTSILHNNGIRAVADLQRQFGQIPPSLKIRSGVDKNIDGLNPRFAVIAADLTTETKVEFPRMASLYWEKPEEVNPAIFARASMSVPYFFQPLTITHCPEGEQSLLNWNELAGFNGIPPKTAYFVDGGILSNFPMDIFHKQNVVPRLPTFGVRLGVDRDAANKITGPGNLFGAMFNSIRHLHDYDFILRNPDYKMLLEKIDIGDHNWLNFAMDEKSKIDLFVRGAQAAANFVRCFDWSKYKQIRQALRDSALQIEQTQK
ncbi:MAG: hypothetical protein EOM83_12140 [Clostridia bacterium]|nr:hypothetical protein [Clostridia bacterium]